MTVVVDASIVLRWFVTHPGHEEASAWLMRFVDDPDLFIAPDLLRFEVAGALARLQSARDRTWAKDCFDRFDRLGIRMFPTTKEMFTRAIDLARELRVGGYDAIYLAHAEVMSARWLTADERALRRLGKDARVLALRPGA